MWEEVNVSIHVTLDRASVEIDESVFRALFDASVVSTRTPYLTALEKKRITFSELVKLSRTAQIPYSLFFAPREVVDRQLARKSEVLLRGLSKKTFSLNSRNRVRLSDVELIIKDLLRKQELLKKLDHTLLTNEVVGCLRRPGSTVPQDAQTLMKVLGVSTEDVKSTRTKEAAFHLLVERMESKQILVSQSQRHYMPQQLPAGVRFSGLCVKDKKVPFVFLASGDDDINAEPTGRRVFTLVLLAVLVARGRFAPVTYHSASNHIISNREYEITEEILMPVAEVRDLKLNALDDVKACANLFRVTPSAMVMRARRLGILKRVEAEEYLIVLAEEYAGRAKRVSRSPLAVNALRKYNGSEFSRRMVHQLDAGRISPSEFCRVVLQNKMRASQITDFRSRL
jgi:hypothetical protein